MNHFDDDPDDMMPPSAADDFDDNHVEALLRGTAVSDEPRLAELLALARSVGRTTAPQPSAALAALLAGGATAEPPITMDPRWRRRLATVALVSVGSSAALVGAAAANVLPQQAQQVVARVVNGVSPLTLPGVHPGRHRGLVHRPATSPPGHLPADVARPPGLAPTSAPTSAPGTPEPQLTPTPAPGHTPDGQGKPTALPTQANGRGDDHGRPTPKPSAGPGNGHGKGGLSERSTPKTPKTPKATKPTPKTSHSAGKPSGKVKHRIPGRG